MRYVFLLLILSSCGLFKKSVDKDTLRLKSEIADRSHSSATSIERKDLSKVEFVKLRIRKNPGEYNNDTTLEDALIRAISGATSLEAVLSQEQFESLSKGASSSEDKDIHTTTNATIKSKAVDKDSNTTLGANIPWYAWAIGFGLVFLLIYLILKNWKIL